MHAQCTWLLDRQFGCSKDFCFEKGMSVEQEKMCFKQILCSLQSSQLAIGTFQRNRKCFAPFISNLVVCKTDIVLKEELEQRERWRFLTPKGTIHLLQPSQLAIGALQCFRESFASFCTNLVFPKTVFVWRKESV